jgi:hypothetical protein
MSIHQNNYMQNMLLLLLYQHLQLHLLLLINQKRLQIALKQIVIQQLYFQQQLEMQLRLIQQLYQL